MDEPVMDTSAIAPTEDITITVVIKADGTFAVNDQVSESIGDALKQVLDIYKNGGGDGGQGAFDAGYNESSDPAMRA